MLDIDALIGGFLDIAWHALLGVANISLFVIILLLGSIVTAIVIGVLIWIIIFIIRVVKKLYDAAKAHYNRTYECRHCIAQRNHQARVEDDEPQNIGEEAKQSFDEDARTIVGEGNGEGPSVLNEEANCTERNALLKDDRLQIIEEVDESFDENARSTVGQETGKDSLHLNEKANPDERNTLLKDHGQHTTDEDEGYFDDDGRMSVGEWMEKTYGDLNKKEYPEQR